MNFDLIENRIIELFNVIPLDAKKGGWQNRMGAWTERIKKDLCDFGHDLDFSVACSGCDKSDDKEWLYDILWWKQEGKYMPRVILALESEWSGELPFDDDFLKLMLARAEHHVWVFKADTEKSIHQSKDACVDQLQHFQAVPPGDRFLFAGLACDSMKFHFDLYVYK